MSKLKEKQLINIIEEVFKNWADIDEKYWQAEKQIKALIKIFYAKEISKGPIKKDISKSDLIEWLQGINQSATAVKDYYVMKATTQLIEIIKKPEVTEEFVEKWLEENWNEQWCDPESFSEILDWLVKFAKELGVEVVKK